MTTQNIFPKTHNLSIIFFEIPQLPTKTSPYFNK